MSMSIREAFDCIQVGTDGDMSVLGLLFGFTQGVVPPDPNDTAPAQVSVLEQFGRLRGKHVHLNVLRVGFDLFSSSAFDAVMAKIDYAVYKARKIYGTVDLGIGRVAYGDITSAEADGREDIGSRKEAKQLTQEWYGMNDGIDGFLPFNISAGFGGISPIGGTCNKQKDTGYSGAIIGDPGQSLDKAARAFSHEFAHYLGLSHGSGNGNVLNLMTPSDTPGLVLSTALQLTPEQGAIMRSHCFVRDGC